jgi:hypothetical protein
MANSDRTRMLELGQWLQDYLSPGIAAKDYRKLAQKFIQLYNVDFKLSRNDIGLQLFELIKKTGISENHIIQALATLSDTYGETPEDRRSFKRLGKNDSITGAIIQICLRNEFVPLDPKFDEMTTTYYTRVGNILEDFQRNLLEKHLMISIFLKINEANDSWENYFSEKVHNFRERLRKNGLDSKLKIGDGGIIEQIMDSYNNCLSSKIYCERGKFHKIKVFRNAALPGAPIFENDLPFFPWTAAAARVFFDFLFAGGQDHFKFCDYCGGFTVIRRKDSKKFCSDRCRAHHRLDEIAKSE